MSSNFRYPIVLFLASIPVLIIGLLFKIQHWPGSSLIIGSMMMVQLVSIIWLIVVVLKLTSKKS
jgi:hypothetical protein